MMQKNTLKNLGMMASLMVVLSFLSGCTKQLNPNAYSAASAGESVTTYRGIIASVRPVVVESGDNLEDNTLGLVGGGVGGALVGSTIGKGHGNTLAMGAGALLGAVGGAFAEKALKEQEALEYVVDLDNGGIKTVVQGLEPRLQVGQRVYVTVSQKGRSRVTPMPAGAR